MSEFISPAQIATSVTAVREHTQQQPTIALVLGSGLSTLADAVEDADIIPYDQIPNWPVSTVPGHSGRLVIGSLAGKKVLVQQGRSHYYEGYSMSQITLPVRVMHAMGIETLIVTNAAGGINREFTPGDLMLISDHINMPGIGGHNPLRGPNDASVGPRFPDMTHSYDSELRQLAHSVAATNDISLHEGSYVYVAGPSFETPAELRLLHQIGADAVGMSTVPSVIVARHVGIRVLGISTITNKSILDPSVNDQVTHEEVLETGERIIPQLTTLIRGILNRL